MTTTVTQAFHAYLQRLNLDELERQHATRQQERVFRALASRLGPKEPILAGSYGRSTAIRPLRDIDLFLVFKDTGAARQASPKPFLKRVLQALQESFPGEPTRLQNRSANITFRDSGIGFDVVPAVEEPAFQGWYWIPDRRAETWIRSDPRKHKEACDAADRRAKSRLRPLIRAIKSWNARQNLRARSFHLEVLAYQAVDSMPAEFTFAKGLAHLFRFMKDRVAQRCDEPAKLGPPLDAELDAGARTQLQQQLRHAERKADHALALEGQEKMVEAILVWRELLGEDFRAVG